MSKLKLVGFFKELPYGFKEADSIYDAINLLDLKTKYLITSYLKTENILITSPAISQDIIDNNTIIGPLNIVTDGIWAWPSDLAYYLEKYDVRLPSIFSKYIESKGGIASKLSPLALEQLNLAYYDLVNMSCIIQQTN